MALKVKKYEIWNTHTNIYLKNRFFSLIEEHNGFFAIFAFN